jgi:hypothetical protein
MSTKLEQINALELAIQILQKELSAIRKEPEQVSKGDYVIITESVCWGQVKGERMWVDSVAEGKIYCRSANPKFREDYILWVSNGTWVKA